MSEHSEHSEHSSDEGATPKAKRRKYSAEFKLKVVKAARGGSVHSASKCYNISRRTIREWKESEAELKRQV